MTLFLLTTTILLTCYLFYCFLANKNREKKLKNQIRSVSEDLQKLQEIEKELKEQLALLQNKLHEAFQDPITHLSGWQLFEDRLVQRIKESERYQITLGILFVDIDDFKVINDGLGYEVGDILLREMATRIQSCIRQVDSVGRFTKDSFVVLLSQLSKPATAAVVAQRILQALSDPFQIKENELYITASIGISICPDDARDISTLLQHADEALHLAKEKSKYSYQFYNETMHIKSQRDLTLYTSLNRDAVLQEFAVYYQPIVDVRKETIVGMQALLYWQHPHLGLIRPQEMMQLAEKQGKLNHISEWSLRIACKQFLHWRSLGFYSEMISIPLSMKQLESINFVYQLSQILQDLNFKPEWLLLEISETAPPFEALEKSFNMLKYLGVKIAISDFGAGSFPLYYLKNFSFDYLKLDSFLVKDLVTNQQSVAIIQSILFLADNLSCQVIVQDVETEEQRTLLKELGCYLMQGELLGAPLSEQEVADKMITTV